LQSLFFVLFAFFAAGPLTLKHILNPDKEALPWRSYCTSAYPTLYSLQDPNIPITPASAVDSTLTFASPPARNPAGINSFASATSSNLVLTPLTSQHPTWPYHPYPSPLFTADTFSSLDELEPVGILVGVFTTDESVQRRHMIRQSYSSHWRSRREGTEGVTVRFVMGRPRGKYVKAVQLEMEGEFCLQCLDQADLSSLQRCNPPRHA